VVNQLWWNLSKGWLPTIWVVWLASFAAVYLGVLAYGQGWSLVLTISLVVAAALAATVCLYMVALAVVGGIVTVRRLKRRLSHG
jgi:hypothetical protein